MNASTTIKGREERQWGGISRELRHIKQCDQHVRRTLAALRARIHLLETDHADLRTELAEQHRFEGKE
jgi:hypothetical protein